MKTRIRILTLLLLSILIFTSCDSNPATNAAVNGIFVTGFPYGDSSSAYVLADHQYNLSDLKYYALTSKGSSVLAFSDVTVTGSTGVTISNGKISFTAGTGHTVTFSNSGKSFTIKADAYNAYAPIYFETVNNQFVDGSILTYDMLMKKLYYLDASGNLITSVIPSETATLNAKSSDGTETKYLYNQGWTYSKDNTYTYTFDSNATAQDLNLEEFTFTTEKDISITIEAGNSVNQPTIGTYWEDYFPTGLIANMTSSSNSLRVGRFDTTSTTDESSGNPTTSMTNGFSIYICTLNADGTLKDTIYPVATSGSQTPITDTGEIYYLYIVYKTTNAEGTELTFVSSNNYPLTLQQANNQTT